MKKKNLSPKIEASKAEAIRSEIGAAIRDRRQELRLTQQTIADQIGIHRATMVDIESGRPCEINTLLAILSLLKGRLRIEW